MKSFFPSLDYRSQKTNIFELLCVWIASVSLVSITLLTLGVFNPLYALIGGTILCLLFIYLFHLKFHWDSKNYNLALLTILALAFLFRANPYLWIMGGQDQGLYVNMSSYYEKNGRIFITDHVRESLEDKEKAIYDDTNHHSRFKVETDELRGFHQPGVYINDLEKSEYVFQFYPMHPLWMSVFGTILGSDNRVYSLVFFALISILAFYFIALELTPGNKKVAYLVAIFLAINPLHAFFSKFPVSEIVSLAFSSTGFYFLLKYYKDSQQGQLCFWRLLVSASLFLSLFLNHISGFIYLPLFYLIAVLSLLFVENTQIKKHLMFYCGLIFSAYILSVFYGYFYSFHYFWAIFENYIEGSWNKILLIIFSVPILFIPIILILKSHIQTIILEINPYVKKYLSLIFYIFIFVSLVWFQNLTQHSWREVPKMLS